jgi:hypothetical protein
VCELEFAIGQLLGGHAHEEAQGQLANESPLRCVVGHEDNHHRSIPVMKKSPTPHHVNHARRPLASSLFVFGSVESCLPNRTLVILNG